MLPSLSLERGSPPAIRTSRKTWGSPRIAAWWKEFRPFISWRIGDAPLFSRRDTSSMLPLWMASISTVFPVSSEALMFAPWSMSKVASWVFPVWAASAKGLFPAMFWAFRFAPNTKSFFSALMLSQRIQAWMGVFPRLSRMLNWAPLATRASMTAGLSILTP